ncbi:hypothetical protein BTO06_05375 [Tenacibaculum sp. SZ-18]|uniref:hypothetical protein n=1 Tax=Tenacibaculum sp. SZ-18 TaxID=754423 RepID=UPI000C2D2A13|nr:hypothetical protein [Tenacibaculum sp. SZ-18]AUC14601.1 hypothetical protein BTO06_05375 [Tenacibaculum sp. SZ-18]
MRKFFKIIGVLVVLLVITFLVIFFSKNEALPTGNKGEKAEELAQKMLSAINHEAFENAELLEWSFRGTNSYKWYKQQGKVEVSWNENKVILNTNFPEQSEVYVKGQKVTNNELITKAQAYFNNDSFWLIAPHKIMDNGVERSIVKVNNKDALMVTYTSGGTTPGDSYLWMLNENYFPTSYKMWTKIIPIGGVEATWSDWKDTEAGFKLPTRHTANLFDLSIDMGNPKASTPKADALANKILKAIKHDAYKTTENIEWSFGGRRSYKWNKKDHIVEVKWDTTKVVLHPNSLEKSTIYFNDNLSETKNEDIIKKAEAYFNNDSFWLVAPHKLFEPGILRSVKEIDGQEALLVKYTTGGTTPGDSYLWILDENYVPKSYKMYVPSMKMEGVPSTWEGWITTESGTLLPKIHRFGNNGELSMGDVKAN